MSLAEQISDEPTIFFSLETNLEMMEQNFKEDQTKISIINSNNMGSPEPVEYLSFLWRQLVTLMLPPSGKQHLCHSYCGKQLLEPSRPTPAQNWLLLSHFLTPYAL